MTLKSWLDAFVIEFNKRTGIQWNSWKDRTKENIRHCYPYLSPEDAVIHIMDRYNLKKQMTHDEVLLICIDQWGSPEEFGVILYDATMPIRNVLCEKSHKAVQERKNLARWQIRQLNHGDELLKFEDELMKGSS